jgi:hypothetical protein
MVYVALVRLVKGAHTLMITSRADTDTSKFVEESFAGMIRATIPESGPD